MTAKKSSNRSNPKPPPPPPRARPQTGPAKKIGEALSKKIVPSRPFRMPHETK